MRKVRTAAIICGMITSCLFGGYFVVEAATVTLDESSADLVDVFYYNENDYQTKEVLTAEVPVETVAETAPVVEKKTVETTPVVAETVAETVLETEAPTVVEAPAPAPTPVEIATPVPVEKIAPVAETAQTTAVEVAPVFTAEVTPVQILPIEIEKPAEEFEEINYAPVVEETEPVSEIISELETPPAPIVDFSENNDEAFVETAEPIIFEIPEIEEIDEAVSTAAASASITEAEYILICNCVANEAGSNNISETEKAKVVEVIMNRVASKSYPDSIYGVISQKYQFEGSSAYVNLTTFSSKVTPMVKSAVDLYFSDPSAFDHGYLSFYGDGVRNYFR